MYDTDLRIHDHEPAVSQLRLPRAAVAFHEQVATGTHGRASEACHPNYHHSVHETVRSGASGCESGVKDVSLSAHEKAPPGSGRAESSKRVPRFERPTCTLAIRVFQTTSALLASPVGFILCIRCSCCAYTRSHSSRASTPIGRNVGRDGWQSVTHPGAADPGPGYQRFHAHQIKSRLMKQMADVIMAACHAPPAASVRTMPTTSRFVATIAPSIFAAARRGRSSSSRSAVR